jgi:hypothetical protein
MNVVVTAPSPTQSTPSFPDAGEIFPLYFSLTCEILSKLTAVVQLPAASDQWLVAGSWQLMSRRDR